MAIFVPAVTDDLYVVKIVVKILVLITLIARIQ